MIFFSRSIFSYWKKGHIFFQKIFQTFFQLFSIFSNFSPNFFSSHFNLCKFFFQLFHHFTLGEIPDFSLRALKNPKFDPSSYFPRKILGLLYLAVKSCQISPDFQERTSLLSKNHFSKKVHYSFSIPKKFSSIFTCNSSQLNELSNNRNHL